MQIDDVIRYLGNFGRYQTLIFVLVAVVGSWFPAWQMMAMVFTGDQPVDYTCTSGGDDELAPYSAAEATATMNSLIVENETEVVDRCFYNRTVNDTTEEVACVDWDYTMEFGEKTIVTDFDLVCGKAVFSETAQSIFMAGVLVGALVAGTFSDLFGRKSALLVASLLEGVFGVCLAFTWTYTSFVVVWFFVGMFEQGMNIVHFILIIEMFSPEKRTFAGCIDGVMWGIGVTSVALFAYLLPNWRHMQILISVPILVAVPLVWWLAYESIRWEVSKDRLHSAEKTLHRIARLNNIDAPESFLTDDGTDLPERRPCAPSADEDGSKEEKEEEDGAVIKDEVAVDTGARTTNVSLGDFPELRPGDGFRMKHLLKTPYMLRNAFIMFASWLTSSMVYYGMSLNSSNLAGNKYVNFLLLGVVEITGYAVVYFLVEWWGRRPALVLAHCIAGVCSIISACIPPITAGGTNLSGAILAFALMGKFGVTISFAVDFIYGAEIFPTVIRNAGFGWCSFFARIGGIVAPFVVSLNNVSTYIPLNVFGVVSLVSAALVVYLPETRQMALPETLRGGEILARSARPPECPSCLSFGCRLSNGKKYQPSKTTQE